MDGFMELSFDETMLVNGGFNSGEFVHGVGYGSASAASFGMASFAFGAITPATEIFTCGCLVTGGAALAVLGVGCAVAGLVSLICSIFD
ncbi:MAG: hypothetical protein IJL07_11110 [Lachnospiraceae bacterium]|nr:hypothetical protein [Lachnospiraceae bacterium]MBQ6091799.1 hypothetical protein [Lachnospiraceae bacterium]